MEVTTAAAIPYYTIIYGHSQRGFGFGMIGANVDEFHHSAVETAKTICDIESDFTQKLKAEKKNHIATLQLTLQKTFCNLSDRSRRSYNCVALAI
ncbi:MAG: hypothetical protein ACI8PB_005034 [Desulforhopalus sp.]